MFIVIYQILLIKCLFNEFLSSMDCKYCSKPTFLVEPRPDLEVLEVQWLLVGIL